MAALRFAGGSELHSAVPFQQLSGKCLFTSANRVAGSIYEVANEITSYFGLHTVNRDLVRRNVELELQVESLSRALKGYMRDTTEVEKACIRMCWPIIPFILLR